MNMIYKNIKQHKTRTITILTLIATLSIGYTLSALTAQDEKCYAYTFGKAKIEINNTFKVDDIRKAYDEKGTAKGEITVKNTGTVPIVAKCDIQGNYTDTKRNLAVNSKTYTMYNGTSAICSFAEANNFNYGVTTKVIQPNETIPIISSITMLYPEDMFKEGLKFKTIVKAVDVIDNPYAFKTILDIDNNQKSVLEKAVENWEQNKSTK